LIRFDSHIKFYRRREREISERRKFYDEYHEFYAEQLRRSTGLANDTGGGIGVLGKIPELVTGKNADSF